MRRGLIIGAVGAGVASSAYAAQWTIVPSIALQEVFTDNALGLETPKRADAITQLTPGIVIQADGARLKLDLDYHPTISAFLAEGSQDRIDQNLTGAANLTLLENRLEVESNVFATQSAASGSYATPVAGGLVPLNDRVLNYGGVIAPHYTARFKDYATLDVYYRVNSSNTSQENSLRTPNVFGNSFSSSLLQQEGQVLLGSGDTFERLVAQLDIDHIDGSGSGLNNQFQNDIDKVDLEYHVTRDYSIIASAGYERIHYSGNNFSFGGIGPGYNTQGLTWTAGIRAAPNDVTQFSISYGKRQGSYNLDAHLTYDLSQRTSINANYTVVIQNQLQSNLANLQFLSFDQAGRPIDSRTGLPFNAVNQAFGQQNAVFQDNSANVTISHQFTRSTIALTAYDERRSTVTGTSGNDDSWSVQLNYTRELTPALNGFADIGYVDHRTSGDGFGNGQDKLINADVGASFSINETLTANVTYSLTRRISTTPGFSVLTNQLLIGLRKTF